jgi:hypothetical protein
LPARRIQDWTFDFQGVANRLWLPFWLPF